MNQVNSRRDGSKNSPFAFVSSWKFLSQSNHPERNQKSHARKKKKRELIFELKRLLEKNNIFSKFFGKKSEKKPSPWETLEGILQKMGEENVCDPYPEGGDLTGTNFDKRFEGIKRIQEQGVLEIYGWTEEGVEFYSYLKELNRRSSKEKDRVRTRKENSTLFLKSGGELLPGPRRGRGRGRGRGDGRRKLVRGRKRGKRERVDLMVGPVPDRGIALPNERVVTMSWNSPQQVLTSNGNKYISQRWNPNSFQLDPTTSSTRYQDFGREAVGWGKYRVLKFKYEFVIKNQEVNPCNAIAVCSNGDPGVGGVNYSVWLGNPLTKMVSVSANGGGKDVMILRSERWISVFELSGDKEAKYSDNYTALTNAAPNNVVWCGLGLDYGTNNMTTGLGCLVNVCLIAKVRFFERNLLANNSSFDAEINQLFERINQLQVASGQEKARGGPVKI